MIRTLSGTVELNVHVRKCPDHGETNRNVIETLVSASDFDPRVTIAVGIMRWLMDYQISEIQILMESRGIRISTGEISFLSGEFLLRLYCIHRRHLKDLELKDYILHLDGTGESGDEIVFMAKEGITGVTMDARIMPSENSDFITPFLQGIKDVFGDPVSILRDMGNAIKESVSAVFPGILQIICHYHFVKDLGKDVFSSYPDMRASMVSTKALAAINEVTIPERGNGIAYAEKLWIAIAAEYALYPRNIPSKFPFVLPYFQVLERCMEVEGMLESIIRWNASHLMVVKPVTDLYSTVGEITHDPMVLERYRIIVRVWEWFENIRKALRVSRELNSKEAVEATDIGIIGKELNRSLSDIIGEGEFTGGDLKSISGIFRKRIEDHRSELLSPVTGKDGKTINVVRHNGIEEIGHRWSRMHIRRRTGRSQTAREMAMYGALTAVLSNVENGYYIGKVLPKIDFLKEFTSITKEEMDKARRLIRPNPCEPIIRKDRERKPVLAALVKMLEANDDLPAKELKAWVASIKI
ncbi:MAG: hypothetical protein ACYCT2_06620 [Thermoplasmataceae archaeon]